MFGKCAVGQVSGCGWCQKMRAELAVRMVVESWPDDGGVARGGCLKQGVSRGGCF
jgi:hypothetical protein